MISDAILMVLAVIGVPVLVAAAWLVFCLWLGGELR